ncbi:histidine phosphatase family protein [Nocardioides marinquilinus]
MPGVGRLLLVRHGQASFGAADYDVLSDVGHEQGRRLGAWLAGQGVRPTAVLRGGLRRHRETLAAMVEGAGWGDPDVVVDEGWDEFDHLAVVEGYTDLAASGLDRRAFQRAFEEATARWVAGVGEHAESHAEFTARIDGALARALEHAGPDRTAVVVTSGGPIGVVAARLADPDADAAGRGRLWGRLNATLVNAGVTRVLVGSTGARLLTLNEHSHLAGDHLTYR